jgi:regulatory protein YycH of two-component signal transduction system YycFG
MKLEVIKSYTLAILVGISLMLSFSLLSYQPIDKDAKLDDEDELLNEEQINLGGTEESRKSLVQPTQIIFDINDTYYGFTSPVNRQILYEDMTSWVLYNLHISEANGPPNHENQVEVIYPDELPLAIVPSLFTVNDMEQVNNIEGDFSFQRLYITFQSDHSLTLTFLSTDGKTQLIAEVNNAQKYNLLLDYVSTLENLEEYAMLEKEKSSIYLPAGPIKALGYKGLMSKLEPEILKNALFKDPLGVYETKSIDNEIWYQDSLRLMQVFDNGLNMSFIHPQETQNLNAVTFLELFDQSIAKINGYKGWVQDYNLESINLMNIRYQMHFRGYPVFNYEGLATIEQKWVNNELEEHRQPLYRISSPVSDQTYQLDSGEAIISYLKDNPTYELEKVEDIQIGYRLGYQITTDEYAEAITLSLTPGWFIKIEGDWVQVNLDEEQRKGVS